MAAGAVDDPPVQEAFGSHGPLGGVLDGNVPDATVGPQLEKTSSYL